ncbi:MAG: exosortase system-associated protein, TIGR04073 family [Verrucomicrobiota bacterium]|nr:exosortase system-associated protein, TIGR04073 family [Chthoniobacterales bacterium]MDQ3413530.1 exosortase system-associated protein, TIGR04073 family [Verrucomicrobiota bacterium]
MKLPVVLLLSAGFAVSSFADIQDPPAADYGPTRKLSRGVANMVFGWSEIPVTIGRINEKEGNAAGASYGVIKGTGRAFARFGVGFYEALLWPFPVYKGTYYPVLRSDIPWIHRGYSEFPPELGNESKYPYVRDY